MMTPVPKLLDADLCLGKHSKKAVFHFKVTPSRSKINHYGPLFLKINPVGLKIILYRRDSDVFDVKVLVRQPGTLLK